MPAEAATFTKGKKVSISKATRKTVEKSKLRSWLRPKVVGFLGSKATESAVDSLTSKAISIIKLENWEIDPLHAPSIRGKQVKELLKRAQGN